MIDWRRSCYIIQSVKPSYGVFYGLGLAVCEIDQREVLLCEALCRGLLDYQTPAEAAALLSCFVYDSHCEGRRPFVVARLQAVAERMLELACELKYFSARTGVDDGGIDFHVSPGLVEATYAWARGNPLSLVAGQSGADEGHLLRAFKRLGEVLQQACKACRRLGYEALQTLMCDAHVAINRGALTKSSLYISDDMWYRDVSSCSSSFLPPPPPPTPPPLPPLPPFPSSSATSSFAFCLHTL
ncbi:unnamed protein product [Mesocestoides corti]|uniref:DSHCT domain-containing protein n=1 Tax=Mesocestoides corti TaxID=53468 RepID=A0A0R3UBS9_MESCO|nr:unnamed protein product [Mesocestoides corti]